MKILRVLPLASCLLGMSSFAFAQTPPSLEVTVSSAEPGWSAVGELSAAMNPRGEFVVLWPSMRPAAPGTATPVLLARWFAAGGTSGTEAVVVSEEPTSAYNRSAVAIREDGSFLAVHQRLDPDGFSRWSDRGTRVRRYGKGGAAPGRIRLVSSLIASPGIAMDREDNFALFRPLSRSPVQILVIQRFNREGLPLEPILPVSTTTSGIRGSAILGNEAGDLVALWTVTHIQAKVFSAE